MTPLDVDGARRLMHDWVASPALRGHMEAVAACMETYARELDPERTDRWIVAGLLHDFDYERHPTAEEHPYVGVDHLRSNGLVEEEIAEAILGHATASGVPRRTAMARTLFAVDELAGFIVACGKVRPDGLDSLQPRSVRKKLKDRSFAAAVSREDITGGVEALGVPMDDHIARCIGAIRDGLGQCGSSR